MSSCLTRLIHCKLGSRSIQWRRAQGSSARRHAAAPLAKRSTACRRCRAVVHRDVRPRAHAATTAAPSPTPVVAPAASGAAARAVGAGRPGRCRCGAAGVSRRGRLGSAALDAFRLPQPPPPEEGGSPPARLPPALGMPRAPIECLFPVPLSILPCPPYTYLLEHVARDHPPARAPRVFHPLPAAVAPPPSPMHACMLVTVRSPNQPGTRPADQRHLCEILA